MAGYEGFSKSNNAIEAESSGLFPASKIAKKLGHGITPQGIREVLDPAEYHHTSSRYNPTDYYDLEEAKEHFEEIKKISKIKSESRILKNAQVEWLEWGGTRAHPVPIKKSADGCTIDYKGGAFCLINFADGKMMRKKLTTNGFFINGRLPESELQ